MAEHVLVLNCGSSSIKYQLVDVAGGTVPARGLAERIGEATGRLLHKGPGQEISKDEPIADHDVGLRGILAAFEETGPSLTGTTLAAIGHRVVHGGDQFADPVLITDEVVDAIDRLTALAPLHNPANLAGIRVAQAALPDTPQVAVFDTAFHQTLPRYAYTYAIPPAWRTKHGVRRYGFHGTSVAYVAREAATLLGRDVGDCNLIVLHLGNGASATAVASGHSVDTSMGLTPLEGLVMGTRSGDVDPAVVAHLRRVADLAATDVDQQLNRASGLTGLAGVNDMREINRRAEAGEDDALLALEVYCYRIRKYVGAYYAALGRVDGIVFTAGVGENNPDVRARSLSGLERLGIELDPVRNASTDRSARVVSTNDADVTVLVVPTNEELEIARQSLAVVTPARPDMPRADRSAPRAD
jgi:acetate kinase